MILTIGRKKFTVADYAEASRVYSEQRDASGRGASTFPTGTIDGWYHVSYNGKVWEQAAKKDWHVGMVPLYNPYVTIQ